MSSNGAYIAIGSPFPGNGRVYIYTRSGATWSLQDTLTPSITSPVPNFGQSISLDDSNSLLVVGAPPNLGGASGGHAYVFSRSGSTWSEDQVVSAPDVSVYQWGADVAMSGDGTAFNVTTFKTGTPSSRGRMGVYYKPSASWVLTYQFTNPYSIPSSIDAYGEGVSISNDGLRYFTAGVNKQSPSVGVSDGLLYVYEGNALIKELDMTFPSNNDVEYVQLTGSSSDGKLVYGWGFNSSVNNKLFVFING